MAEEATGTVVGRRKKEPLKPGHTLADWGRLCSGGKITNGEGGLQRKVKPSELRQHTQPHDAWVVFNGRVYNITPYLEFHPGGASILLNAAGKDVTKLFNATHKWVNGESLLKACLIGPLVPEDLPSV